MIFVSKMYVCTEMHGSITYIKSILSCAVIDAIEYVGNTRIWFIIVKIQQINKLHYVPGLNLY